MQDPHRQGRVLTILYKLAQMRQPGLLRLRIILNDGNDRVCDRRLVLQTALVPQHRRQEIHENAVLPRELQSERSNRLHHDHLKLIAYFRNETGDLLHEPVHGRLRPGFQQSGDRQSGDRPVRIGNQILQVQVARGDGGRMVDGDLVQRSDGGETQRRFREAAEHLENADGGSQLSAGRLFEVDDGVGRLVDDHLGFVAEAGFDELEVGGVVADVFFLEQLCRYTDLEEKNYQNKMRQ